MNRRNRCKVPLTNEAFDGEKVGISTELDLIVMRQLDAQGGDQGGFKTRGKWS